MKPDDLFPNETTIDPKLEQQIAKNHARLAKLPDITAAGLLGDWEAECARQERIKSAARARGEDLPLFA